MNPKIGLSQVGVMDMSFISLVQVGQGGKSGGTDLDEIATEDMLARSQKQAATANPIRLVAYSLQALKCRVGSDFKIADTMLKIKGCKYKRRNKHRYGNRNKGEKKFCHPY
jgi:hypothetical protein